MKYPIIAAMAVTLFASGCTRKAEGQTVAVVNGHGQRVTRSVTFVVTAPLVPKTTLREPRLGEVIGFGGDRRPLTVERKALVTPHAVRQQRMRKLTGELEKRVIRLHKRDAPR